MFNSRFSRRKVSIKLADVIY